MKKTLKNKSIDIDGTEFLENLRIKLEDDSASLVMKNNIIKIIKSKKIYLDTITDLYTHLTWINRSNTYYFDGLAYLVRYTHICPHCAVEEVEFKIYNDEKLFDFLQPYFDLGFNSDSSWKAIWRDDNE